MSSCKNPLKSWNHETPNFQYYACATFCGDPQWYHLTATILCCFAAIKTYFDSHNNSWVHIWGLFSMGLYDCMVMGPSFLGSSWKNNPLYLCLINFPSNPQITHFTLVTLISFIVHSVHHTTYNGGREGTANATRAEGSMPPVSRAVPHLQSL